MGGSLSLEASVEPTVSIRCQKDQSFSLHLKDMKNERFNIQLSDESGFVFINESVEDQDDYLKFFNLKKLPAGNYMLRVENELKISLQTISINNRKLSIKTSAKKEIYKPSVKFKNPYLDLNMLHFENDGVAMTIKDKQGYVLHKENIFLSGSITKRFVVTALPYGDYVVEINTKHYSFEQEFSISQANKLNAPPQITGE